MHTHLALKGVPAVIPPLWDSLVPVLLRSVAIAARRLGTNSELIFRHTWNTDNLDMEGTRHNIKSDAATWTIRLHYRKYAKSLGITKVAAFCDTTIDTDHNPCTKYCRLLLFEKKKKRTQFVPDSCPPSDIHMRFIRFHQRKHKVLELTALKSMSKAFVMSTERKSLRQTA